MRKPPSIIEASLRAAQSAHPAVLPPSTAPATFARADKAPPANTDREHLLRSLPGQLGYADSLELIAALEQTFGLPRRRPAESAHVQERQVPAAPIAPRKTDAAAAGVAASSLPPQRRANTGHEEIRPLATDSAQVIHAILNQRLGQVQAIFPEARRREIAERETLADALHQLFQIGLARTPGHPNRAVRESEVERVTTILRRISLIRGAPLPELVAYAAAKSAADTDEFVHLADPFHVRHLLSFHQGIHSGELPMSAIARIHQALDRRDPAAVRAWFSALPWPTIRLPRETPAFLKRVLLERMMAGETELAPLVFEQAVLDVRLYGVLGWENTRCFYALLKRLTGAATSVFDAYLEPADIESCVRLHEEFGDQTQLVHFIHLRTRRDAGALTRMERMVANAAQIREATRPPVDGCRTSLSAASHGTGSEAGAPALTGRRAPALLAGAGLS